MIFNKIPVSFGNLRTAKTPAINYQYDITQVLVIKGVDLPETYVVDFCNVGDTSTVSITSTSDGVAIPDTLLQTGKDVKGYIVVTGEDGDVQTRYELTIPVKTRPTRTDIEPTPAEQLVIDQLVTAMNEAVDSAEQFAETASDYADEASGYADDAEDSATLSESWAVGGTGTRTGEDTNNAAYYAGVAQQGAEASGYAWFDVDLSDGHMYVTVTDTLSEDVAFSVNESNGTLEVIVS